MKPVIVVIFLSLLIAVSCSRTVISTYSISGVVNKNMDGMYVELYETDKNTDILKDADTIIDGKFMLTDTISNDKKINIYLRGKEIVSDIPLGVWVGPLKNAYIKGKSDTIINWEVESDVDHQKDLNIYRDLIKDLAYKDLELLTLEYNYMNIIDSTKPIEDSLTDTMVMKLDSLQHVTDSVFELIQMRTLEYMKIAPVTYTWKEKLAFYTGLLKYNDRFRPELENLVERIDEDDQEEDIVKDIMANLIMIPTAGVGEFMIDGYLHAPDNTLVKVSDYLDKNILMIFSSCDSIQIPGLVNEIAEIENINQPTLSILNISLDEAAVWEECLENIGKVGVPLNQLRKGLLGLENQYRISGTPFFVFINSDGVILDTWQGYKSGKLKKRVNQLINDN